MKFVQTALDSEKFREFFLIVLFAAIPFSIAGDDFAIIGLYLVTIYRFIRGQEKWENQPIVIGMVMVLLGALISSLFSDAPLISLGYFRNFWRFGLPFMIYFALKDRRLDRYLVITLIISGLVGIYAVIQFNTGLDLFRSQRLQSEYRPLEGVWYAVGIFSHHLTYGGVSLLLFSLFAPQVFNRERSAASRWLYAFGAVFNLTGVAVCMGRSIWLGAIAAIGCLTLFFLGLKRSLILIAVTAACLSVFIGLQVRDDGSFFTQTAVGRRLASAVSVEKNMDRLCMWKGAVETIADHPLLGLGPRRRELMQPTYQRIAAEFNHQFQHPPEVGVHNIYLQNWIDFGLLGFVGHFVWWFGLLWVIIRVINRHPDPHDRNLYLIGCLAGLVGIMVAGFFENNVRDGEVQTTIFVVMGIALVLLKRAQKERISEP